MFDAISGHLLFSTHSLPRTSNNYLRFDRTGQRLAAARTGDRQERVGLWSVADAREYRSLVLSRPQSSWGEPAIHPSGRLAALGVQDGVVLFDLETGRELAHLPILSKRGKTAGFDGAGSLLTNSFAGLFRWPIRPDPANRDRWIVASPERLPFHAGEKQISASRDGRVIAQCMWNGYGMAPYAGGWIRHPNFPMPSRVRAGLNTGSCSVSADGRWAAFGGDTVHVFDAATGKCVWQSPSKANHCRFSPDGRWLATDADGGRLYTAGVWEPGPQLGPGIPWDIAPDSTLAILGQANGIYRLVELATGRELARLEDPEQSTGAAAFTPDGAKLVVAAKNGLRVWDLRRIRAELSKLELDWQEPPLLAAAAPPAAPLSLQFEVGDVRQWARAVELETQANQHLRKKEHAKALAALRQAVKLAPAYAVAHNNLAWLLLSGPKELRDLEQALHEAQKAVESGPQQAAHLNTLGAALYYTGRFADAIPILERSVRAQEDQADSFNLFLLAMCYHRLRDTAKAKDCLERGARWFEQHKGRPPAKWVEEITAFQAEAKNVLAQPPDK